MAQLGLSCPLWWVVHPYNCKGISLTFIFYWVVSICPAVGRVFFFLFFYKRLRVCSHTFLQNYFGYLFEEFLSLCVSFNRLVCTSSRISSSFWNRSAFLNKRQTVSRPLHEVFREVRWYLWQPATVYNRLGQKCLENVLRYAHAQKIHPVGKFLKSWDISN